VKIVYFIDHLRPDGTQRVLTQLVRGLGERGHSQAVVCLNDSWDAEVMQKLQASGCDVRMVGKAALASGVGLLSTYCWLRRERFERAVTLLFYADVLGRPLARAAGVPRLVTYIQARNTNYSSWQRWLVHKTMPLADQVVVCTRYLGDYVLQAEGATVDQIRVIPHGIAVNGSKPYTDSQALRSEFNIPVNSPLMGSLGRLTRQKGYDVLLEALADMVQPDVHLLIAGNGEALADLQAQAERLNLSERVHFAGYRRDAPAILHALDVYVQPSRFEGMPNAVLEAMAASCPIVASGVDGHRELIQDGVSGWLVPPEDSRSLAKALAAALANPEDARRRGLAARQKVQAEYSLENMIAAWSAVLGGNHVN
jgi:glycosyltransferase involved in cell wall biosynthesis